MLEKKPIKITDLTFRDFHQSLFATRRNTEDMLPWRTSKSWTLALARSTALPESPRTRIDTRRGPENQ